MEAASGEWFVAYRTLQSISQGQRPNVSWRVDDGPPDEADGLGGGACVAVDAIDEVDDECFHTSDFEPFSDDDTAAVADAEERALVTDRALKARLNRRCRSSDIGRLDYSLFEPLRSGGAAADEARPPKETAGSGLCSGPLGLLCRTSASSEWRTWWWLVGCCCFLVEYFQCYVITK